MTEKRRPHWPISLRLPPELREPLRRAAAAEDRTISNLIVHALRVYLERTGAEEPR